jgi:hypothetical protein
VRKLLIIWLILSSCSAANRKFSSEPPHFFACSKWIDLNQDGIYDYYEFQNKKDTFHASEEVLFVGFFSVPSGSRINFSLYAPDGSVVKEVSQIQLFSKSLLHANYQVGELISGKAPGVWQGVWEVDDEEIAVTEVNFLY